MASHVTADTLKASSFINGTDHLFEVDPTDRMVTSSVVVNFGSIFGLLTAPADIAFAPSSVAVTAPESNSITLTAALSLWPSSNLRPAPGQILTITERRNRRRGDSRGRAMPSVVASSVAVPT